MTQLVAALVNAGFSTAAPKRPVRGDVWVSSNREDCAHIIGYDGNELEAVSIVSKGDAAVTDLVRDGVSLWKERASIPLPAGIRI